MTKAARIATLAALAASNVLKRQVSDADRHKLAEWLLDVRRRLQGEGAV